MKLEYGMAAGGGGETARPGRTCPLAYRYGAASLARAADFAATSLIVVGGLYGNPFALDAVLAMRDRDPASTLVFNGDFNWFDIDDSGFARINAEVLRHPAIRGNVETELLAADAAAGCGCGYPDYVSQADVDRSNLIMERLARTAQGHRTLAAQLANLPMTLVAQVGQARVAVVHGDADSLAGWSFGEEAIDATRVARRFEAANADVFASSHTCAAVAQVFATARGPGVLFNNGAAGMPNFAGTRCGLATRIGIEPAPAGLRVLYRTRVAGVHVEALAIEFDHVSWVAHFDALWPAGSPASVSYRKRIVDGPAYALERAPRAGIERVA